MQKVHVCLWVTGLVVVVSLYAVPAMAQIEINDIDELQLIGNDPGYPLDGDYVLGNDVDASATAGWNSGAGFEPIGDSTNQFTGSFDGQGYTITNLTINRATEDYVGLFGYIEGVAIRNVALEDVDVSGNDYIGGLVGYSDSSGNITNCYSTGTVSGNNNVGGLVGYRTYSYSIAYCYSTGTVSGNQYVGGLVGNNYYSGSIVYCYSTGTVSGNKYVGGLVGDATGFNFVSSTIANCYSTSMVSGEQYIGGLVGRCIFSNAYILNSYSIGAVTGDTDVGGLVGYVQDSPVMNCYWDMETSGQTVSAGGTGKTTEEMMQAATFAGWDFEAVWEITEEVSYPYLQWTYITDPEGEGGVIEINDIDELQRIGNHPDYPLDGDYVLGNDIDASATTAWNDGAGFKPIAPDMDPVTGSFQGTEFTGTFDGQGYAVTDLKINRPEADYVGLFGYTIGAAIQNVILEGVDVSGCGNTGGLVGFASQETNIIDCASTGTVSGCSSLGGLVGCSNISCSITNCYSTGMVLGEDTIGGLVGHVFMGNITNCFSTSMVLGEDTIGGLAGYVFLGSIAQCYSTGVVSGNIYIGGLLSRAINVSITDCYWNVETSGQTVSAGGIGKTTAEMMQQATFINWDFTTIWGICENVYYPYLRFHPAAQKVIIAIEEPALPVELESPPITFNLVFHLPVTGFDSTDVDFSGGSVMVTEYTVTNTGDDQNYTVEVTAASGTGNIVLSIPENVCSAATVCGTSTNIFVTTTIPVWTEINDVNELQMIGNNASYPFNGAYRLGNDIDASVTAQWNGGAGFTPIAPDTDPLTDYYQGTAFAGTFDGQGYAITQLTINRPTEDYVGLFGYTIGATIQNVVLEDTYFTGSNYVGGLVGSANLETTIMDCSITGTVSGNNRVGGLVGYSGAGCNITYCYNMGMVSGSGNVGGLMGYGGAGGNITYGYNMGTVSGGGYVGGIAGYADFNITRCYNSGIILGNAYVGGLVGSVSHNTIMNCYSTNTVSGTTKHIGGLIGYAQTSSINECYSTSNVSGTEKFIGGLVGSAHSGSINECYSTGAVSGTENNTGGLLGYSDLSTVTDCYWDTETSGQTVSDGGTGKTTVEMMQQATFVNWDFVTVWSICEGGSYPFFEGNLTPFPIETTINVAASQADPTNTLPLVYDVVFSRPITGFDADDGDDVDVDFSGSTTAITGYTVTNSGDDMHYTVEVTGIDGDGVITATIPSAIITDSCFAMSNTVSTSTNNSVTYDVTPPTITIGPPSQKIVAQGELVAFTVDYTGETSSWLTGNDITLDMTGDVTATVTVVPAKSNNYIVTLSNIKGSGTLGFTIAAGTAMDAAGNFATAASAPVLVTAEPEVPVSAVPLAVLLLGAGVAALRMRRRNK